MIKVLLNFSFLSILLLGGFTGFSQNFALSYTFTNVSTTSGRTDPTPLPTAGGLVADSFRAVGAIGANPNATGRFSFTNWPTGATNASDVFTGSIDLTKYYEVTITPLPNYTLKLDSITFTLQRSSTGIRQYAVRSSLDAYSSNLPAFIDPANTNLQVVSGNVFQVSDATANAENGSKIKLGAAFTNISGPVTFRFYAWNAESTAGTFSIDNVLFGGAATIAAAAPNVTVNTTSLSFPATNVFNISQPKTYTVKAENLNSPLIISTSSPYFVSADNINYSTTLSLTPADVIADKTIYVKFSPTRAGTFNGTITNSTTGANTKTIAVTGDGIDPANLTFNFDNCTAAGTPGSGFMPYSISGSQTWACSNFGRNNTHGVDINGFAGGTSGDNEDWLISPRLTFRDLNLPILRFWSRGEFSGPPLQLLISTNYDGSSDPNTAIWKDLNASFPPNTNTWTLTDGIDLSAYKSFLNVYIAFKYTSSVELGAARWTLDDIDVTNRSSLLVANPVLLSFGEATVGNFTAAQPFTVKAIGYGDVTLTAPSGYQLSRDSISYATSLTIPAATVQSDTKVYARFAPTVKALKIEGTVRFTGTGLDSSRVTLTGTSYPKSETFDAGCYNLSFFGSNSTNNPTQEKITTQIANIATVINRLNLDVLGIEEVSNDTALTNLVRRLPNRSSVISKRWSYSFDPPDPNFPPQKTGFIYDTTTMKLIEARDMFVGLYDSARNGYPQKLPNYPGGSPSSFWASGRLPFMATFNANINGVTRRIRVIDIHAKSASDAASYNRRAYDAKVLKDTLDAYYKNESIIIVGDYNDRVIGSIYAGATNSPYKPFVDDNANYTALTLPLDQAGRTSFIGGSGLIDQITISNALLGNYISNSTEIEDPRSYISNYNANTASDHLPVYTRFNFAVALPVTLTKFNAQPKGSEVLVTWTTANELNSSHYVVERSVDGRSFTAIGTVNASGYIISSVNYQLIDPSPLHGLNYYRLKQVDVDGKYAYSATVTVNFVATNVLNVYPNPVANTIEIRLNSTSKDLVVQVTGLDGVLIVQGKGDIKQINQQISQQLPRLKSGMYILQLSNAGQKHVIKFIKE
jgi:trimeric autotransporter adhesin